MCSLCGVLAGRGHWTESTTAPEAFRARRQPVTHGRERQQRVALVNRVLAYYGLSLSDWSGSGYVLRSRTGRTAMVENLSEVWAQADKLAHLPCDPLDEGLLGALVQER